MNENNQDNTVPPFVLLAELQKEVGKLAGYVKRYHGGELPLDPAEIDEATLSLITRAVSLRQALQPEKDRQREQNQ